jgi:hypothetical protein
MYPCEEQCYKCCSKWDETCDVWNKYGPFTWTGVYCAACAGEIASSFGWGYLAKEITGRELAKKVLTALGIGLATLPCYECAQKVGEGVSYYATKCCIGEWYDCDCRCVSIRW